MKPLKTKKPDELQSLLFAARDGLEACDAINALAKLAKKGDIAAKNALALYVIDGSIKHMISHACAGLASAVAKPDPIFAATFKRGLMSPDTRYWSITGYINAAGKEAYGELLRIAEDASVRLEDRVHAIKCLARYSKQKFDRGLPADPGLWNEGKLRISELRTWAEGGFRDGVNYPPPNRHPALDDPKTIFEQIVSRLDKKLAKNCRKEQHIADPTDWLTPAAEADIERIRARWTFPSIYLDFLSRFSPLKVIIENRQFSNGGLWIPGAKDLIDAQDGYSFNSLDQVQLKDWPMHLVVIASYAGDPFVLDLSGSNGIDAPVDTAEHGAGVWEFERFSNSFSEFLEELAK